jgi:hypothetical protein
MSAFGGIDLLVNNAAVWAHLDRRHGRRILATHLRGQRAQPLLKEESRGSGDGTRQRHHPPVLRSGQEPHA